MSVIIDRSKLTETLWRTSLSLALPPSSLKLQADQFFQPDFLDSLAQTAAKLSMSIEIDPELTDAIKYVKAARMGLIRRERIIRDGQYLLMPESVLEDFILAAEQNQKEAVSLFSQFDPKRMIAVRDELAERVQQSIEVALTDSRTHNKNRDEILEVSRNAALLFVNQSFPDLSSFTTVELTFEVPIPAIQPIPGSLTEETVASIRRKQRCEVKRLWDLLVVQYQDIEGLVGAGGLQDLEGGDDYRFLTHNLLQRIAENREVTAANRERRKLGLNVEPLPYTDVLMIFGAKGAKNLRKKTEMIQEYIAGMGESLDDLVSVYTEVAEQHSAIEANLKLIPSLLTAWEEANTTRKKAKMAGTEIASVPLDEEDENDLVELSVAAMTPVAHAEIALEDGEDDGEDDDAIFEPPTPVIVTLGNVFEEDEVEEEDDRSPDKLAAEIEKLDVSAKNPRKIKKPVARRRYISSSNESETQPKRNQNATKTHPKRIQNASNA
jgi:hypothetical protein